MVPINRNRISLYQEAKEGLRSLFLPTIQVFVGLIIMLLVTGGSPLGFIVALSFCLGVGWVAVGEKQRLTNLRIKDESNLEIKFSDLIKILENTDFEARKQFINALCEYNSEPTIEKLIKILEAPNSKMRWQIVNTLSQLRSEVTIEGLIKAFKNPIFKIRIYKLINLSDFLQVKCWDGDLSNITEILLRKIFINYNFSRNSQIVLLIKLSSNSLDFAITSKFKSLIRQISRADTDNFLELAKLINLDPTKDFSEAYLRDVNLSYTNLTNADLNNTDLRYTNLAHANLRDANLENAILLGADLSNADLSGANVKNARLGNNKGISKTMKLELIQQGAIFEDSPGDRSEFLSPIKNK